MKKLRNKAISTLFGALAVANMMTMTAFAEGDVAGLSQAPSRLQKAR